MRKALLGVTAMTLLSYGGEYIAFTSILAWLYLLLVGSGMPPLQAYGFGFLVSSAYLLLSGILAVPFGSLADSFGRRNLAIAGCLAASVAILALSLTGGLTNTTSVILVASVVLGLIGIGHATYTTSALAYAGDISSAEDVGEVYGLVETAEYTMFMFGTPLGLVVAQIYGNQLTFIITGVILALGALTAFVGMPEQAHRLPAQTAAARVSHPKRIRISLLRAAVADHGVLLSLLSILVVSLGFTVFRIYMTQYGSAGQPAVFAGPLLVSVMAAASTGSAVPIGWFLDKTRRRTLFMAIGFLAEAMALGLIFLGPTLISLLLWSVVFGVAIMMVRVPQAVIIAERTIFENRAGAMGANHGVEHVGYGLGAFLGGLLVVSFRFTVLQTFWFFALVTLGFGIALLPLARLGEIK